VRLASLQVTPHVQVKLSDFGILSTLDEKDVLCNTFVGTILYLSPERMRGYLVIVFVAMVVICIVVTYLVVMSKLTTIEGTIYDYDGLHTCAKFIG
jgi:serine/threonine protein kinase